MSESSDGEEDGSEDSSLMSSGCNLPLREVVTVAW